MLGGAECGMAPGLGAGLRFNRMVGLIKKIHSEAWALPSLQLGSPCTPDYGQTSSTLALQ